MAKNLYYWDLPRLLNFSESIWSRLYIHMCIELLHDSLNIILELSNVSSRKCDDTTILNRVGFEIKGEFVTLPGPFCNLTISISAPSFNRGAQYLYPPKSSHVYFRDLLGQYFFQDFFINKYNHIHSCLFHVLKKKEI